MHACARTGPFPGQTHQPVREAALYRCNAKTRRGATRLLSGTFFLPGSCEFVSPVISQVMHLRSEGEIWA